jgi:hypothetical protein
MLAKSSNTYGRKWAAALGVAARLMARPMLGAVE